MANRAAPVTSMEQRAHTDPAICPGDERCAAPVVGFTSEQAGTFDAEQMKVRGKRHGITASFLCS